jgi:hypothetical protein
LRNELQSLQRDLERVNRCHSARFERNSAHNSVNAKEREITEAEKAPPPVIQPLPSSDDKALKILFFLYMSDEFKTLSRLSLVAQQLLVPRPWVALCGGQDGNQNVNVFDQIKVKQKYNSWCGHYNDSQTCIYHTPREKREGSYQWLDISMHSNVPEPKDVGPSHIKQNYCPNDGIWYPDDPDDPDDPDGMVDLLLMTSTRAMENLILLRYKTVLHVKCMY